MGDQIPEGTGIQMKDQSICGDILLKINSKIAVKRVIGSCPGIGVVRTNLDSHERIPSQGQNRPRGILYNDIAGEFLCGFSICGVIVGQDLQAQDRGVNRARDNESARIQVIAFTILDRGTGVGEFRRRLVADLRFAVQGDYRDAVVRLDRDLARGHPDVAGEVTHQIVDGTLTDLVQVWKVMPGEPEQAVLDSKDSLNGQPLLLRHDIVIIYKDLRHVTTGGFTPPGMSANLDFPDPAIARGVCRKVCPVTIKSNTVGACAGGGINVGGCRDEGGGGGGPAFRVKSILLAAIISHEPIDISRTNEPTLLGPTPPGNGKHGILTLDILRRGKEVIPVHANSRPIVDGIGNKDRIPAHVGKMIAIA